MTDDFWRNWTATRNGSYGELEFFANSLDLADRTLSYAIRDMGIPGIYNAGVIADRQAGYVAIIVVPLWVVDHLGVAWRETS